MHSSSLQQQPHAHMHSNQCARLIECTNSNLEVVLVIGLIWVSVGVPLLHLLLVTGVLELAFEVERLVAVHELITGRSVSPSVSWLVGWSIGWSVGWSVYETADYFILIVLWGVSLNTCVFNCIHFDPPSEYKYTYSLCCPMYFLSRISAERARWADYHCAFDPLREVA